MNKITLFLVEGITDQISLEGAIENIFETRKLKFYLCEGDLTSRNDVTSSNIKAKLGELLKHELGRYALKPKDIQEVIHIVDTDGTYVNELYLETGNKENFYYTLDKIIYKNIDEIKSRNERKSKNLKALLDMNYTLKNIPYRVYCFSSNLEHVFHNKLNPTKDEKRLLANKLEMRFFKHPHEFLEILNNENIKISGDYKQTWEYLKKDNNSLKRGSNFHLYFDNDLNNPKC